MHTIGVRYRRNDCLPATGQRRYNDDDALESLSLSRVSSLALFIVRRSTSYRCDNAKRKRDKNDDFILFAIRIVSLANAFDFRLIARG